MQENPKITQREMAKALGISLGGINYCLQALLEKGWVKVNNFQNNKRKLAYAYLLTPAGIAQKVTLTGRFLKRKMEEYELLKAEIDSLHLEANGIAHNDIYSNEEISNAPNRLVEKLSTEVPQKF